MTGETVEKGFYSEINRKLKDINRTRIDVGYFSEDTAKDDASLLVAQYAFWNDKGTKHIPERPFLSIVTIKNQVKYRELSRKTLLLALENKLSVDKAMNRIGNVIKSDTQLLITNIRTPLNAPSTIAKKRSSNPLIDEGHMRKMTRYKVGRV